jgi:hypothetical protein
VHFRLTCNQRAVLIEELVARRRLQCTDMASNMTTELKKAGVREEIVRSMRDHGAEIERRSVEVFNVDDAFRFVLNTTISLKECIEAISATANTAEGCFGGAESGAAVLAQLMEYFGPDHLATMTRLGDHVAAEEPVPEPEPEAEATAAELKAQPLVQPPKSGQPEQRAAAFDDEVMLRCERAKIELVGRATAAVEAMRVWKDVLRESDRTRSGSGNCRPPRFSQ